MTFSLKVGDTAPLLTAVISYTDGTLPDLTGASATFAMRDAAGVVVIPETACTVNAATNAVSYAWSPGDTDTAGEYTGEFTVLTAGSKITTFPSEVMREYIRVTIWASFGDQPIPPLPLIFDGSWILDGSQELDGVKNP